MTLSDLRNLESTLRILLDLIHTDRDPRFIKAYEKLLEAQDLIHSIRRQEQQKEGTE